jgi:hypothetical protein
MSTSRGAGGIRCSTDYLRVSGELRPRIVELAKKCQAGLNTKFSIILWIAALLLSGAMGIAIWTVTKVVE